MWPQDRQFTSTDSARPTDRPCLHAMQHRKFSQSNIKTLLLSNFIVNQDRKHAAAQALEGAREQARSRQVRMGKRRHQQDDSSSDEEGGRQDPQPSSRGQSGALTAAPGGQQQAFKNKEKVLILSTRGITFRLGGFLRDCCRPGFFWGHAWRRTLLPRARAAACMGTGPQLWTLALAQQSAAQGPRVGWRHSV